MSRDMDVRPQTAFILETELRACLGKPYTAPSWTSAYPALRDAAQRPRYTAPSAGALPRNSFRLSRLRERCDSTAERERCQA